MKGGDVQENKLAKDWRMNSQKGGKMKYIKFILLFVVLAGFVQGRALIDPQLEQVMARTQGDEQIEVLIVMKEQSDEDYLRALVADLPRREQRYPVVAYLKQLSQRTQTPLINKLATGVNSNKVSDIQSLWIINAVYCKATPGVVNQIANDESVEMIAYPYIVSENILLTYGDPAPVDGILTVEWNIRRVAADSCWTAGYKGQGVIVGIIDTGVNYNHLDLRNHMWNDPNYPNHGWNFELNNNDPMDNQGHGTHCAGTIASDGSAGDSCGMAPQCSIMVCRVRTSIAYPMPDTISEKNVLDAMQFVISPPLSPNHGADVVSMSLGWFVAWTPRRSVWRKSVTNVALAGIPYFIAAGNERGSAGSYCPVPYNLRCPGDVPPPWHHPSEVQGRLGGAISIAATDNTDALASFSSCGPSCWENAPWYWDYPFRPGPGILKPDIAAPGVNITSCAYNNNSGYISGYSGTSMATPHCAGLAALLLSKNPNLTVAQIDSIMQFTALDLGTAGKDTMFGAGRIRAKRAIDNTPASGSLPDLRLAEFGTVVLDPPPSGTNNGFFEPSETITLVDTIINLGTATATNVTGKLRTTNSHITIIDSTANFGSINAKAKGHNGADPFVLSADTLIQIGTLVPFELELTAGTYTRKVYYQLRMGSVFGPDSAGYFCLDNTDNLYTEAPVYNWIEINPNYGGAGTSIGAGGPMVNRRIRSPIVIRHYAKRLGNGTNDSISVCSNGWICFGRQTITVQHNSILPKVVDYGSQSSAPNMVAAFWDTLNTGAPGSTWWYYNDAANHRFIIQYDSVAGSANNRQTFQIIIYDSTLAGPGLKNDIVIQYKRVTEPTTSCTIGQQDSLKKYGLCYLFNKMYDTGAAPLVSGRAIKFTTKQPRMIGWVGTNEFNGYIEPGLKHISLAPNPARNSVNIYYTVDKKARVLLKVYNTIGQHVQTIVDEIHNPGVYSKRWNGTDDLGREVSSGVYFFNLNIDDNSYNTRGILLR